MVDSGQSNLSSFATHNQITNLIYTKAFFSLIAIDLSCVCQINFDFHENLSLSFIKIQLIFADKIDKDD